MLNLKVLNFFSMYLDNFITKFLILIFLFKFSCNHLKFYQSTTNVLIMHKILMNNHKEVNFIKFFPSFPNKKNFPS